MNGGPSGGQLPASGHRWGVQAAAAVADSVHQQVRLGAVWERGAPRAAEDNWGEGLPGKEKGNQKG